MTDTTDLVARLNAYFVSGGLFNPELANHTAVSELVRDSRDAIERLTRERDQADAAAEAHEAKWQSFCKAPVDPDGAGTCACSYDQPGDVCLFHSPKLAAAEARIAKLEAALDSFVRDQQSEAQAGTGEYQRGYDDCIADHADRARAALEDKP
jgi:hypothetical protein